MQNLKQAIANIKPDLGRAGQVWLAYSGGLDSTVLLHVLKMEKIAFKALHINHQLSPNADSWQQHCIDQCNKLDREIVVERVEVKNKGKGLEQAARQARYFSFDRHVKAGDVILMAHHLDDDCETLLFRLLRGCGLKGLAGIKRKRNLTVGGRILRPLLSLTRNELLEYANLHTLSWVEDESNRDTEFDRNYLREMVLPLFQQRWPGFRKQFSNSVKLLRESEQLLSEYGQRDLRECDMREERLGNSLNLTTLSAYSVARKNHVLREWLDILGYTAPGLKHLDEIQKMIDAREDAAPVVDFGECELRRYRSRLYCLPRLRPVDAPVLRWDTSGNLELPDGSCLSLSASQAFPYPNLEVTFRRGGERSKPLGRARSQTLKKLLQEYELEPWLRDRVPLIHFNSELIAVGDLWLCDSALADAGAKFSWAYPHR